MTNKSAEWHEAKRQVLLALDLPREFQLLGLELANGATPNSKGWMKAHAIGVVDREPSAGICVQDGPTLGFYSDFRNDSNTCNLFDFAIRAKKCDFGEALKHYAEKTKVKLPGDPGRRSLDSLVLSDSSDLANSVAIFFTQGKPGFTPRALKELGGRQARYPKKSSAENSNQLIASRCLARRPSWTWARPPGTASTRIPIAKSVSFVGRGTSPNCLPR